MEKGAPVAVVFPDQQDAGLGTLIIPNTVALIKDAPHAEAGKQFIDFLLSKAIARELVRSGWFSITIRDVALQPVCFDTSEVRGMPVDLNAIYDRMEETKQELQEIFIR